MGLTSRNYDNDSSELWDRHPEIMTMTRNYETEKSAGSTCPCKRPMLCPVHNKCTVIHE